MKILILLSSLLFSAHVFSNELSISKNIEVTEERFDDYYNYYFGKVKVNHTASVRYHVRNTGNHRLDYKWSRMMGDDTYKANTNCFGTIYPGFSCQVIITYAPYYVGRSSAVFEMQFYQDHRVRIYVTGDAKE